jgi:translocator protein
MHTRAHRQPIFDHPWRIAALVAIVANVVFNYATALNAEHSFNLVEASSRYPSLFTPAGYAFVIWGVIYGASLTYAVLALLPTQLNVHMHDRIAPWLLLTNVLGILWTLLFTGHQLGPSVLVMLAMFTASLLAYSIANEHLKAERLSRWWRAPFALWLGWLAVASLANLNLALAAVGGSDSVFAGPVWASLLLCTAAGFALTIEMLFDDAVVPFVVSWAAAAIAVATWNDSTLVAVVAALIAVRALLWGAASLLFDAFPIPQRYRKAAGRALHYDPAHPDGM